MFPQVNICPKLWEDVKFLRKKTHNKELKANFPEDEQSTDEVRVVSIPLIKVIITYMVQTSGTMNDRSDKYDRQPFLSKGWTIYKLRYAFDNRGASHGLRIIYCKNEDNYLLVYINLKTYCVDERALEKEFIKRINEYLCLNSL